MNKDCFNIQNQIPEYLQARLPKASRELLQSHLDTCEDCQQYLTFLKSTLDRTDDIDFEPSKDLESQIKARLLETAPKNQPLNSKLIFRWSVAAAIICILFIKLGQEAGQSIISKSQQQETVLKVFTSSINDNEALFTSPYTKYSARKLKSSTTEKSSK